jgi:adenylate cyclase
VDKFVGDAVSSVFLDCGNAVRCAVRMQAVTDALCYELIANNQDHLVRIGVGIHYASVGIGVLGNDKHHSCSIVSSEIAVPAQLEALTKEYGARIIITEQVADLLKEGEFENRVLGRVRLSLHSEKEYRLYEIYAPDALEVKQYKQATAEKWDKLVEAQDQDRLSEMGLLIQELEQAAALHNVTDLALQLKAKATKSYDQFDMA